MNTDHSTLVKDITEAMTAHDIEKCAQLLQKAMTISSLSPDDLAGITLMARFAIAAEFEKQFIDLQRLLNSYATQKKYLSQNQITAMGDKANELLKNSNKIKLYFPLIIKASDQVLNVNRYCPTAWWNKGLSLFYLTQNQEALAALKEAKRLGVSDAESYIRAIENSQNNR